MAKSIATTIKNQGLVAQRRAEIIDVATRLFLDRGFHKTSIRDIARACPFNLASLYMYITSKEDILFLVAQHLIDEKAKAMAGVEFAHVPYRGSAPGLTDVMSGQIQGMFDNVTSSFELVKAGKLRALGVTTQDRSDTMPDVPQIGAVLRGFETASFYGVGAPRGTPRQIVDLLNREINAALADPVIKQRFGELGAIPLAGDASEFGAMLATETERWRKVVTLSGHKQGSN